MISSHLKSAKKFKGRLNSSRNCSVCNLITFNEMESSFPRFNHAGSVRNFRFPWQFPSLNATFSKPTTKKQCFLQFFRCLSCFSAAVAKGNLPKTPAIVSLANFKILLRHPRLALDWLSMSFFDYWPIRMSDLLLSLHWINPILHWINSLLHWITWKLHLS